MKSKETRQLFYFLLFAGLVFNTFLCGFFTYREINRKQQLTQTAGKMLLENLHSQFNIETVLKDEVKELLKSALGKTPNQAAKIFADWKVENHLTKDAADLVFFDNGKPLNCPEKEFDNWMLLLKILNQSATRKFRLEGPQKNRLIKFLYGGVGFETLESKPGLLRRMNRGPERTFGAWATSKPSNDGKLDSLFFMLHEGRLSELFMARSLLNQNPSSFGQVAYLDTFQPENSILPDWISPYEVATLASTFDIKNKKGNFKISGEEIYLSAKPDGRMLLFIPREQKTSIPFLVLSLPFFWIPFLWRYTLLNNSQNVTSLKNLLFVVALICILLPASLTGYYWKTFLETRRQSIKIEFAKKLEKTLIQLDVQHQRTLRVNKKIFREFIEILDGNPQNLQLFIDQSVRMEVDMKIGSLLLVDKDGNFIRQYSSSSNIIRNLVFYPKPFRQKIVKQNFDLGWVPHDLEVDYALNTNKENFTFADFVGQANNQGQVTITALGKMAGKDILHSYNDAHGFGRMDGKKDVSTMVMSSFIDDKSESPIAVIKQNLSDFVEFGLGEYRSRNFVDVIKDADGRGVYCAIIWAGSMLSTRQFHGEVFARPHNWPKSVKFMAISKFPLRTSFPWPDAWKRMESLLSILQPPRNLLIDEVRINGVPHLRCAYVAKKCLDFILVAYMPLSVIESKVQSLKTTLVLGSLLLLLTLIFVFWRLEQGIVEPARQLMKGVDALERKDHSYQIKLQTGDEWEQLGVTFNSALEGLKEMEVAHFVQTCILPATDIVAAGATFVGKTVPADDVGGDYYDAFVTNDGMTFIMGDVSGHSVSAALVVNMAKAAFVALVDSGLYLPHEILVSMNSLMLEHLRRIKMMTCFAGFVSSDGDLTYSNAGQAYPFVLSEAGIETLKQTGYPLGASKKKKFKFDTVRLPDKCRIVMFSDGVIEALNDQVEPFGYERLEELLLKLGHHMPRKDFIHEIFAQVRTFAGGVPWDDDVTVVVLDYLRKPA